MTIAAPSHHGPEMSEPTIVEAIHDVAAAIRELAEVMAAARTTIPYEPPPGIFRRSERMIASDVWHDNP